MRRFLLAGFAALAVTTAASAAQAATYDFKYILSPHTAFVKIQDATPAGAFLKFTRLTWVNAKATDVIVRTWCNATSAPAHFGIIDANTGKIVGYGFNKLAKGVYRQGCKLWP